MSSIAVAPLYVAHRAGVTHALPAGQGAEPGPALAGRLINMLDQDGLDQDGQGSDILDGGSYGYSSLSVLP